MSATKHIARLRNDVWTCDCGWTATTTTWPDVTREWNAHKQAVSK